MALVDEELGATPGPYFLSEFGLVDITFAPFLERIAASVCYYKGFAVRGEVRCEVWRRVYDMNDRAGCSLAAAPPTESPLGPTDCSVCLLSLPSPCRAPPQGRWPNLERWFNAMEQRPAYLAFKSDYYTHCHDLPPQLGGCVSGGGQSSASGVTTACLSSSRQTAVPDPSSMFSPACLHAAVPEAARCEAAIDGTDGASWHLPLPPLTATSLEPHSPGEAPALDRLQASNPLSL